MVVGGLDKMVCPHCGVEGNIEKNPEEDDEFHFHCKDCDEWFNPEDPGANLHRLVHGCTEGAFSSS